MQKNVESFVENRRSEGGQLLSAIETAKGSGADREQTRLKELMERMSVVSPSTQSSSSPVPEPGRSAGHRPPPLQPQATYTSQPTSQPISQPTYNPAASPPITPRYPGGQPVQSPQYQNFGRAQPTPMTAGFRQSAQPYNPNSYGPVSPPPQQQFFSPPPGQSYGSMHPPSTTQYGQQHNQYTSHSHQSMPPPGWQPPPPPPGPPPSQDYSAMQSSQHPAGPGGYASDPRPRQQQGQGSGDPWAGLSGWK